MSPQEEADIIRREFKHRGKRSTLQVLVDLQAKLSRVYWKMPLAIVVARVERLNIKVEW